MNELLIPEDLLQLEKLKFEIELHDFDISFLGLIGIDTRELMLSFNKYFKKYDNIYFYTPSSSDIFNEILNLEEKKDKFIYINLFHYKTSDFIMKLLFFRDFIADYNLKLFFILNKNHYNLIIKNAIDFYNVSTFSYLFATYKVAVDDIIDRTELDETINEYRTKIKSLNKKQKLNFLYEIGYKCNSYGDYNTGLKYLLEALSIAEKVGDNKYIISIKYLLGRCYLEIAKYNIAEKYYLEVLKFYKENKSNEYIMTIESLVTLYYYIGNYDKALEYVNIFEKNLFLLNNLDKELMILKNKLMISEAIGKEENEELFKRAFILAEQSDDSSHLTTLYQLYGSYLSKKDLYKEALETFNKVLMIYKNRNSIYMIFVIYLYIGRVYIGLNDYKKAFIYFNSSYNYFKNNDNKINLFFALRGIYTCYFAFEEYEKALEKSYEAISVVKNFNNKEYLFDIYIYINQIRKTLNQFDLALNILDKAKKLNLKNEILLFHLYSRYADTYCELNNIELSNEYFLKAQEFSKFINDSDRIYMIEIKAEILVLENKYDQALLEFNHILNEAKKVNNLYRIISIEKNLAYLYKKMNKFKLSKRFFIEAIMKIKMIYPKSKKIEKYKKEINEIETILGV